MSARTENPYLSFRATVGCALAPVVRLTQPEISRIAGHIYRALPEEARHALRQRPQRNEISEEGEAAFWGSGKIHFSNLTNCRIAKALPFSPSLTCEFNGRSCPRTFDIRIQAPNGQRDL